ncbi:hypothetical protein BDZ97DRAFT_2075633 [Flammula alnicola]|nr:hypothetical protein BDZ97DRAFT_2075633 [Flammula alnicola]
MNQHYEEEVNSSTAPFETYPEDEGLTGELDTQFIPILTVYEDILREIFCLVTDQPASYSNNKGPFTSLRQSSQVCSLWRKIILGSPSLWGKVIALNELNQETDYWRTEVLNRAKKSFLHIQGSFCCDSVGERFFVSLLDNHWARIRSLHVVVALNEVSASGEALCRALRVHAPYLQHFQIVTDFYIPCQFFSSGFHAFAGGAPALRYFEAPGIRISHWPRPSWLSQLRCLKFTSPFTAYELLDALSNMPSLETFGLYARVHREDGPFFQVEKAGLPTVFLPRLQDIDMKSNRPSEFIEYSAILDHIIPAGDCSLLVRSRDIDQDAGNLVPIQHALSTYCAFFSRLHKPPNLQLFVADRAFRILQSNSSSTIKFQIFFAINLLDPITPLLSLSSHVMQSVVHLILTLSDGNFGPTHPNFVKIISSLPSVRTLETRPHALQRILDRVLPGNHPTFFGSLETVKLIDIEDNFEATFLFAFLMHRKSQGLPISTIDLHIPTTPLRTLGNLSMLDSLFGLKVVWGPILVRGTGLNRPGSEESQEYICGSGNPEALNFTSTVHRGIW